MPFLKLGMIGNETGHLLKCVKLNGKCINISETFNVAQVEKFDLFSFGCAAFSKGHNKPKRLPGLAVSFFLFLSLQNLLLQMIKRLQREPISCN